MLHCSIANASRQAHSEAESKVPVGSQAFVALLVFSQSLPTGKGVFMNLTISGHHLEVTPALRG